MTTEALDLLTEIGQLLVKIQLELEKKDTKHKKDNLDPLTGYEEWVKQECEEAIPKIREHIKDSDLYA